MVHLHQVGEPLDLPAADTSSRLQVKAAASYLVLQVGQLHLQLGDAIRELPLILRPLRQPWDLHFINPPAPFRRRAAVVWITQAITRLALPLQ
jgi:hypothetical protein